MLKLNSSKLSDLFSNLMAPFNGIINKSHQDTEKLLDINKNIIQNISESDLTDEEKAQQYSEYFDKDCEIVKEQQNHDIAILSMIISGITIVSGVIISYASRKSENSDYISDINGSDDTDEENLICENEDEDYE